MNDTSRSHRDYTVACICPMGVELAPVLAMLDETHDNLPIKRDHSCYTLGRIGEHNIVVTVMSQTGNNRAAAVAAQLVNEFPSVRFALLIGIGGGVPDEEGVTDIRLGDIAVSKPIGAVGGVVQYDLGKFTTHGRFQRTGVLDKPPPLLLSSVDTITAKHALGQSNIRLYLSEMMHKFPAMVEKYSHPGIEHDQLFKATYQHEGGDECQNCDFGQLVQRKSRVNAEPEVHYGTIGSANAVVKDGVRREQLRKDMNIICVEMEAAGLMDTFPCLVVRGICDYADSHKNKRWQPYAAATAAAYMKELLVYVPSRDVEKGLKLVDVVEVSQISNVMIDTSTKLREISEIIQTEQRSTMMNWLSSVNFWGKQHDLYKRAQEGTGGWILDDQKFKSWLAGQPKSLWCEGVPGAGKTILSSIIINYLSKTFDKKKIGLSWIYLDYREHDLQTIESLFTNILVQLFKQRGEISISMTKSLGFNWKEAKPSLTEYKTWLQEEVQKFDQTFVIVDALDEMHTTDLCKHFIRELQGLKPAIHLLVTSRPYPDIRGLLSSGLKIEIRPRKEDVILYIESRLKSNDRLRGHIEADSSLPGLLINLLTQANDRMFLKAELILNVLEQLKTLDEVKIALLSLPPTYDGCYDFSLKQIEMQGPTQRDKAFKVLSWLSYALGPLSVQALQQALSVEPGDVELDKAKQPSGDDLVSVCRGLVVIDSASDTQNIRLLHETAREYLKNIQYANFPSGHEIILKACLDYLSLREFSKLCGYQIRADERSRQYAFLDYAAKYWPEHAIQGNLESSFQSAIIRFLESTQRQSADELMASRRHSAWGAENSTPWTDWNRRSINRRDSPLHAAATYGLRKTVGFLLRERGYEVDRRNNFGETALHRAAQVGQTGTMEELTAHRADLCAKVNHHYLNEATPMILATNCLQVNAVRVLLNHGVDVNTFDAKYRTFPLHLAASLNTELTQLILDHGAFVNFPAKSPVFPESWPMTSLHFAVFFSHAYEGALDRVNLLLDRGADINAQSSLGNTALHMAILGGNAELTRFLLHKNANIHLQNKQGKSAVQLAREGGHFSWIEEAVPPESLDELQEPSALCKAIWSKNYSRIRELLEIGCDIEQKDRYGNTTWDYCILGSDVALAQILIDHMNRQNLHTRIANAAFETAMNRMTAFDYTDQKTWEESVRICRLLLPAIDSNLEFATARSPICGYNKTYLIWAAELGRISEVQLFLDCGSDVNAADTFGNTGLHYAVGNTNFQMVELLVTNGADPMRRDREGFTVLQRAEMTKNVPIKVYLEVAVTR